MSILSLLSLPGIVESVLNIIGKHVTDPAAMAEIKAQMAAVELPESTLQAQAVAQEQKSPDRFISLTRSVVEWTCITGLVLGVIINPFLKMFDFPYPAIPMEIVLNLLYAVLGLGATRLAESMIGNRT